jgi:hypothetical protein
VFHGVQGHYHIYPFRYQPVVFPKVSVRISAFPIEREINAAQARACWRFLLSSMNYSTLRAILVRCQRAHRGLARIARIGGSSRSRSRDGEKGEMNTRTTSLVVGLVTLPSATWFFSTEHSSYCCGVGKIPCCDSYCDISSLDTLTCIISALFS